MVSSVSDVGLSSYYSGQAALSLLAADASGSDGASATDASVILSYYQAKEGIPASDGSDGTTNTGPAAPWDAPAPSVPDTVQKAVGGAAFIDPNAASLSAPAGASTEDYKNLFALYQGLTTLNDIAQTAAANFSATNPTPSSISPGQLQSTFASGLQQVQDFLGTDPFKEFNVTEGKVSQSEQSTVGIANGANQTYATGVIATGDRATPMSAFQGAVQFTINVQGKYSGTTTPVNIDLADMGAQPRTVDTVVSYINRQLKAAGMGTTFSVASLGTVSTTAVNGVIPANAGQPQWGLTVNGMSSESVSFSSPAAAPALYVGEQTGGAPTAAPAVGASTTTTPPATTPVGEQMIKLQASNSLTGPNVTGDTNLPVSGVFSHTLPAGVTSIQASATGSDGSVYMVADVAGSVSGAPIPGTQGVALLKYDGAGKLLYSKVLTGTQDATGYALAVNTDGSVAVAGSDTTAATATLYGVTTPATTNAFVQVFDSTGAPSWTQTVAANGGTAVAAGVAFGSDGSVYLSGTTKGSIADQPQVGASDEFIQGFKPDGAATFTTQYGSTGDNAAGGLAYDPATGSLYTAGLENSQAVVRRFDLNGTSAPTLAASRNLGVAKAVVGVAVDAGQVIVGGDVGGATINVATAQPNVGIADAFVATLSTGLQASAADSVSYVGTAGATETATAMAVAGGQAYLTGTVAGDAQGMAVSGATEGFVTGIDTTTGAASYAVKFAGPNGQSAPTSIAVAAAGVSVLDRLGLPDGAINVASSTLITANAAVKAGDSFYVRTAPNGPQTAITISATDTITTLAAKLTTALGSQGAATVIALSSGSNLEITPSSPDAYIELDSQPTSTGPFTTASKAASTNVLAALGLNAGVIRTVKTVNGVTDVKQLREYALQMPAELSIDNAADAQKAMSALQAAIGAVQQAYQDLVNPPTIASEEQSKAADATGTVPAYLTAEIANYQAGLQRLEGG